MIHIIAHRGEWHPKTDSSPEPNSLEAFVRALKHNFGIEVDIRDYQGKLCISHNPILSDPLPLRSLLEFYAQHQLNTCIAFNIKADGLQTMLQEHLAQYQIKHYFTFDMSIPNTLVDAQANLHYFLRQSEFELYPQKLGVLYAQCKGIWIDQFELDNNVLEHNFASIPTHIAHNKKICWVSPELHLWGRKEQYHLTVWQKLKQILNASENPTIYLCTDFPAEAEEYFNAGN